jgi:hypothetical protein
MKKPNAIRIQVRERLDEWAADLKAGTNRQDETLGLVFRSTIHKGHRPVYKE